MEGVEYVLLSGSPERSLALLENRTGLPQYAIKRIVSRISPAKSDISFTGEMFAGQLPHVLREMKQQKDIEGEDSLSPIIEVVENYNSNNLDCLVSIIPRNSDVRRAAFWAITKDEVYNFKTLFGTTLMGTPSADIITDEYLAGLELLQTSEQAGNVIMRLLRLGTGGTMNRLLNTGDAAVSAGAVRADGTSWKYAFSKDDNYFPMASPEMMAACEIVLKEMKANYLSGVKVTKDSLNWEIGRVPMNKEVQEFLKYATSKGVIASSMESSVIYTIARVVKEGMWPAIPYKVDVQAGSLLTIVNDFPLEEGQEKLFSEGNEGIRKQKEGEKRIVFAGPLIFRLLYEHERMKSNQSLSEIADSHKLMRPKYKQIIADCENKLHELHPMWSMGHPK
jgi:uridine phosphorylase